MEVEFCIRKRLTTNLCTKLTLSTYAKMFSPFKDTDQYFFFHSGGDHLNFIVQYDHVKSFKGLCDKDKSLAIICDKNNV